ncbi:hypothetical protein GGI08_000027 [Coemansia sp. S2]|nr:hypothetical protein LPJ71_002480 [Coemansia sp. S17]KAJ2018973.1 hypothetical protein GGI14_001916 [Coemansia sp. S680]KAJ2070044.1 hypothetical protein GGI08_000027 [Coemansia sp. S2]KAJ2075067.1 hypothetical protein GGH13_000879 [Coemansia sp. S155-1]KAJ2092667.1 hypothetical protein GGI09_005870 [Coemansia sp. S100]
MGLVFQEFIEAPSVYTCVKCKAHVARRDDIISRTFQGRLGRAYLTESVVNERLGKVEDRLLMTGVHTVCDLHCRVCGSVIGWKYVHAHDAAQKYKEGRYVLEQTRITVTDPHPPLRSPPPPPSPPIHSPPPVPINSALVQYIRDIGSRTRSPMSTR